MYVYICIYVCIYIYLYIYVYIFIDIYIYNFQNSYFHRHVLEFLEYTYIHIYIYIYRILHVHIYEDISPSSTCPANDPVPVALPVCCSLVQCVAVWCSVLHCGAVCCNVKLSSNLIFENCHLYRNFGHVAYGVASISRLLKIIGLFCKRPL